MKRPNPSKSSGSKKEEKKKPADQSDEDTDDSEKKEARRKARVANRSVCDAFFQPALFLTRVAHIFFSTMTCSILALNLVFSNVSTAIP